MTRITKFLFSLMLGVFAGGITFFAVNADVETDKPVLADLDCGSCHAETEGAWHGGAHGMASVDSIFVDAWSDQGQPGACLVCHVTGYDPSTGTWKQDGVSCEACHGPANENHPMESMPIKNPEDLCGQCHSEARFGWSEWESSTHYARSMTCTICHDPHTAALKAVEGHEEEGASALCLNCHRQYDMTFSYSIHMQEGVNCIDCHLRHYGDSADRAIHTMPDHSFTANIDSCNTCHAEEMHTSADAPSDIPSMDFTAIESSGDEGQVTAEPSTPSPYGFAGIAGILGLAGGMVLSPWLEKWYKKMNRGGTK